MIAAHAVTVRRGGRALLDGVSLSAKAGELLAILGPNGAGKSTLLRVLSGALPPDRGEVVFCDRPLASWGVRALARQRAVLTQAPRVAFAFTALEVALLGRVPFGEPPDAPAARALARRCLAEVGLADFADRDARTLSGGERQRLHLARALVQLSGREGVPRLLLLDEPTSAQDLRHEQEVLACARRLADQGVCVIAVLHDLDSASGIADAIALMADGALLGCGPPEALLTAERVERAYGIPVLIRPHPFTGRPTVLTAPWRTP